jgi:hypothetical protein
MVAPVIEVMPGSFKKENCGSKQPIKKQTPISKIAEAKRNGVTDQVVVYLTHKHEPLSLNPQYCQKGKKKKKPRIWKLHVILRGNGKGLLTDLKILKITGINLIIYTGNIKNNISLSIFLP